MNRLFSICIFFSFFLVVSINAQESFQRTTIINTLQYEGNGFGGIVGGVDFDKDGKVEIYLCNVNTLDDPPSVLIPRLYKFEWNGTSWDSVWSTITNIPLQNTWPGFTTGDLDSDGKPEIIWLPVNYTDAATNPNPPRILVYEYPGDGSDNMGVSDGFGGFTPNAQSTVVTADMQNVRPCKSVVIDIDSDGKNELIFADRSGSSAADYHIGIWSVDDVPDNGGNLETWTQEFSGVGDINISGIGNNWDVNVIDNIAYLFGSDANGSIFPVKFAGGSYSSLAPIPDMIGKLNSFKGSQVADIDGDGKKEMVVGSMFGSKVYLLQPNGDGLTESLIADFAPFSVGRMQGSGHGDLDSDGKIDFVFGTRNNTATLKKTILRLEYQGGDIANAANYIATAIDSLDFSGSGGGEWDVISVANYDNDSNDEIIYTAGYPRGAAPDVLDVYFLDATITSVEKETDVVPASFYVDQNFPNPFNPSTVIKFGITEAANVNLRVYDILGREVAVLINNEFLGAGSYNVKFDAAELASGTYVYRISSGQKTVSMKMQLLK